MTRRIERIEYRRGLLETGAKADDLPIRAWQGPEIPEDVHQVHPRRRRARPGGRLR